MAITLDLREAGAAGARRHKGLCVLGLKRPTAAPLGQRCKTLG